MEMNLMVKCEKEIKALENTMKHLSKRNKNYRDKFLRGAEGADLEKKQILEEQCRAASETLFKKRKEVQKLSKEFDDDMRRLTEIQTKQQNFLKQDDEVANQRERIEKELSEQQEKIQRADDAKNSNYEALSQAVDDFQNSSQYKDIIFESEQLKTRYIMNAIATMVSDIPDLAGILEKPLQDIGLDIPQMSERPNTGSSQRSRASQRSGGSGRSQGSRP